MTTITVDRLTKRFGATTAVDELSFTVEPGRVTGVPRPQRGRQVDHPAADAGAGHDPRALLLDEPANGLDAHGVAWLRGLLRAVAVDRAVLVSSHLLAEMQLLAVGVSAITRGAGLAVVLLGLWAGLLEPRPPGCSAAVWPGPCRSCRCCS
jgi:ABC-type Na+ transport system ATPase subunit NatA